MGRRNISGFSVYTLLVLTLLLLTTNEEMGAEARTCETASNRFKGICVSSRNCAAVCNTEGFPEGDCKGFRRRCFCTRPCLEAEVKN